MRPMKIALTNVPPDRADAISRALVEEHLVACVSAYPVRSTYRWKDKLEIESEITLMIKVATEGVERLRRRLRELHPYELPEFVVIDVDAARSLPEYVAWVESSRGGV